MDEKHLNELNQQFINQRQYVRTLEGGILEITTPFLDALNDSIQLYLIDLGDDGFLLTDDGYTMWDLEASGYVFDEKDIARYTTRHSQITIKLQGDRFNVHVLNQENVAHQIFRMAACLSELSKGIAFEHIQKKGSE